MLAGNRSDMGDRAIVLREGDSDVGIALIVAPGKATGLAPKHIGNRAYERKGGNQYMKLGKSKGKIEEGSWKEREENGKRVVIVVLLLLLQKERAYVCVQKRYNNGNKKKGEEKSATLSNPAC